MERSNRSGTMFYRRYKLVPASTYQENLFKNPDEIEAGKTIEALRNSGSEDTSKHPFQNRLERAQNLKKYETQHKKVLDKNQETLTLLNQIASQQAAAHTEQRERDLDPVVPTRTERADIRTLLQLLRAEPTEQQTETKKHPRKSRTRKVSPAPISQRSPKLRAARNPISEKWRANFP